MVLIGSSNKESSLIVYSTFALVFNFERTSTSLYFALRDEGPGEDVFLVMTDFPLLQFLDLELFLIFKFLLLFQSCPQTYLSFRNGGALSRLKGGSRGT